MAIEDFFGYFRPKQKKEALSDIFKLADGELIAKIKEIVMAIDVDKIHTVMENGLRVTINIQIAKDGE